MAFPASKRSAYAAVSPSGLTSRRTLLRWGMALPAVAALSTLPYPRIARAGGGTLTAENALARLMEGNTRFAAGTPVYPDMSISRRESVARGQHPFAAVLSCADSRVPVETVFDQGLGDIFVLRVAGNIATPEIIGSIEFGVEEFKIPLVLVLGHERCGAVAAAVSSSANPTPLPGQVGSLVRPLLPAISAAREMTGDLVDNAVRTNAMMMATKLGHDSEVLAHEVHGGHLMIVAARYDLDTGEVALLELKQHHDGH